MRHLRILMTWCNFFQKDKKIAILEIQKKIEVEEQVQKQGPEMMYLRKWEFMLYSC